MRLARPAQGRGGVTVKEKRQFVRYDVRTWVRFEHLGHEYRGETEDLGAGGCRISVPWKLERGTALVVTLGDSGAAMGQATVAWATQAEPFHVGLVFSDALAAYAIGLIQAQLGPVQIRTSDKA